MKEEGRAGRVSKIHRARPAGAWSLGSVEVLGRIWMSRIVAVGDGMQRDCNDGILSRGYHHRKWIAMSIAIMLGVSSVPRFDKILSSRRDVNGASLTIRHVRQPRRRAEQFDQGGITRLIIKGDRGACGSRIAYCDGRENQRGNCKSSKELRAHLAPHQFLEPNSISIGTSFLPLRSMRRMVALLRNGLSPTNRAKPRLSAGRSARQLSSPNAKLKRNAPYAANIAVRRRF